jgi:hypothetical protein
MVQKTVGGVVSEETISQLDAVAHALGWTRSAVIGAMLSTGMPAAVEVTKNGSVAEFRHFLTECFKLQDESA